MRSRKKAILGLLGLLVVLVIAYLRRDGAGPDAPAIGRPSPTPSASVPVSEARLCIRVIDGDTLELAGGERVRLIGVDTPESVDPRRAEEVFGREAAAFTRRQAEGQRVRLEYDEESRDSYGRLLAYIFLPDGTLLNAEIIRQGYGFAYTRFPYRRQAEFVALEREAREQRRGVCGR